MHDKGRKGTRTEVAGNRMWYRGSGAGWLKIDKSACYLSCEEDLAQRGKEQFTDCGVVFLDSSVLQDREPVAKSALSERRLAQPWEHG